MKNYCQSWVSMLATAAPSVRWTLILFSLVPLILMGLYLWVLATTATHTTGALMLFSQLVDIGGPSQQAKDAAALAFSPSISGSLMLAAFLVSGGIGGFVFVLAVEGFKKRKVSGNA